MPLRPVKLDESHLGQPLPWDLYTASGVLIARAGLTVEDPAILARLAVRPIYRKSDGDLNGDDLGQRLRQLAGAFPETFRAAGSPELEPAIRGHASELIALAHADHDACLGLLRLLPIPDLAARHCLLVALVALDIAEQVMAPDDPLIGATVCAAMTMNIGAMALHAQLAEQRSAVDAAQRDSIASHPLDSLKLLEAGGLRDRDWLAAVAQHHENLDGSGYPGRLRGEAIDKAARIIRLADFYVAKVRARRYRPAMSTRSAFKQIFGNERARLDGQFALLLVRRLGLYPPGTLVRLASRETAVVTRRLGRSLGPGKVTAFVGAHGRMLKDPVERNTDAAGYTVLSVVEAEPRWPPVRWEGFWGY